MARTWSDTHGFARRAVLAGTFTGVRGSVRPHLPRVA
jgi:hypothetical protein